MPSIKAGEINLEYYVEGSGPPLLMIMGFAGSAMSWGEPFLEEMRRHFTITRFSNRGTGTSDRVTQPFTVRTMADDAVNLLDALGMQRPHVLGISMGGMIAQELVLNYPERVNGLVLGCTSPGISKGVQAGAEIMGKFAPAPGKERDDIIRDFWTVICSPGFITRGAAFLDAMVQQALESPTPMETLGLQMMAINQADTFERLPQIKAPTLVIHGDVDMLVPTANAPILADNIPGARLEIIPGAAHMFFWEQPETSAAIISEFLSRVPAAA
jgi:pimeloyl-ACP methyl ester carboxylesterase